MSEVIFKTLMSLFIGSVLLSLTACVSDGGYDGYEGQYGRSHHRNDGHHEGEWDRTFKPKGGGGGRSFTSDILAGGL